MFSKVFTSIVLSVACSGLSLYAGDGQQPLKPYLPVPNEGQIRWHRMETYAFVHFTVNTFTDKEWGYGDESPDLFNPTAYDPDQVVGEIARAGFKGLVLTAKHHDGFCLWPTSTTKHSVAHIKWKDGKGDVVKDYAEACKKHGIAFGIYVSPWDRNHADYGTPKYIDVYRAQLKELLTSYGDVFIVWHDGANGGDGYYGGNREKRSIDASTYYRWPETWAFVKKLQPDTVIFSDVGQDIRWVGNERGYAGVPCWATYTPESNQPGKEPAPGITQSEKGINGTVNGKYWMPAEVDVSIRPGWFWHASQNSKVRTPEQVFKLYMESVGRGANLNLNIPPDRRGMLHEVDVESLRGYKKLLDRLYETNFAEGAKAVSAGSIAPESNLFDGNPDTWWAPEGLRGSVEISLPEVREFDVVRMMEPIRLGQRVRKFEIHVKESPSSDWTLWQKGESIGAQVLVKGDLVKTDSIRITVEGVAAQDSTTGEEVVPALSEVALLLYPQTYRAPSITSDAKGRVLIDAMPGSVVRYTLDGSQPTEKSAIFNNDVVLPKGGLIKAAGWYKGELTGVSETVLPMAKDGWKVTAEEAAASPSRLIDGNVSTLWNTHAPSGELPVPQAVDIDFGEEVDVAAIVCTPRQDGNTRGTPDQYEIYISKDGLEWGKLVSRGEFSNIKSNPVPQTIELAKPEKTRYLRINFTRVIDANHVTVAELDVISPVTK